MNAKTLKNNSKITEKIINKIFFKKLIFKIIVVLTFFVGLAFFIKACSNYQNPYHGYKLKEYDNFIQFVDESLAPDIIYSHEFYYPKFLYDAAFIRQAREKGVFSGSVGNLSSGKYILLEKAYSCDKEKMKNFENEFKFMNKYEYWYFSTNEYYKNNNIYIDCQKAKTVPLAPESYYFIKYELLPYVVGSFVCVPLLVLFMWIALRFIIISPILWILKKDK